MKFSALLSIFALTLTLGCTKDPASTSAAQPPPEFLSLEVCGLVLANQSCSLAEFNQYLFDGEKDIQVTKSWKSDGAQWVLDLDVLKQKTEKLKMTIWFEKVQSQGKTFAKAVKVAIPSVQESQDVLLQSMVEYYQPVANKIKRIQQGN